MNKLQTFVKEHPAISVMGVILISTVLTEIHFEAKLQRFMDAQSASYLVGIIEQFGVGFLLVLLLKKLGMLEAAGFTRPSQWKQIWIIWPILLYAVLNSATSPFDGTLTIDTSRPTLILLFILIYLSTGFLEETLFRGFTLSVLLRKWGGSRKQIYWVVVISNLLFGSIHILNLIMGRRTLLSTASQIVYGTFFGVFFAACFLRNKSIWPVIIAHAAFDLCGNFSDIAVGSHTFGQVNSLTIQNALINTAITLPLLVYGLIILRKVELQPEQYTPGSKS